MLLPNKVVEMLGLRIAVEYICVSASTVPKDKVKYLLVSALVTDEEKSRLQR